MALVSIIKIHLVIRLFLGLFGIIRAKAVFFVDSRAALVQIILLFIFF